MSRRTEKLSQLFQSEVGKCIFGLQLKKIISVTVVEMSDDCKSAKVYVSIIDEKPEKIFEELLLHKNEIIKCLKERDLDLRFFPHFTFYLDKSGEYTQKIDKLLDQV